MSLKSFPGLLADYEALHGEDAELPDWMQAAACMVAVSEELGVYTDADILALHRMRAPKSRQNDEPEQRSVDHAANFARTVAIVRGKLTQRGGLSAGQLGTIYDPDQIANLLAEDDNRITPSHVRAAQRQVA